MFKVCAITGTAFVLSIAPAMPASAGTSQWQGRATNLAGDFTYGKVTFSVKGSWMRDIIIEGVTTSGCGGYKSVVVPKARIKGSKFKATYVPVPGLDDTIYIWGRMKNGKASGRFREAGTVCQNEGRFTARRT